LARGEFPSDGVTEHAISFLEETGDDPFFLMVSHFYVHDPCHTRVRWLHDRYRESLPEHSPRYGKLTHYGAMVTSLDHYVGELLAALEKRGKTHSTLVVFTSDNGGHPNYAGNAPLRGSKWNLYEGGIRVPFLVRWPGVIQGGTTCTQPVWSPDLFPTFAELAGADASSSYDGGSIIPWIRDPNDPQSDRTMVWHFPYYHPETRYNNRIDVIGVDDGETSKTKPHSAIRLGKWKLIHFYEDGGDELYDLSSDLSESMNLSTSHPAETKSLRVQLLSYLEGVEARLPTPNPEFSP
jgi:uncharacterized sulfatase